MRNKKEAVSANDEVEADSGELPEWAGESDQRLRVKEITTLLGTWLGGAAAVTALTHGDKGFLGLGSKRAEVLIFAVLGAGITLTPRILALVYNEQIDDANLLEALEAEAEIETGEQIADETRNIDKRKINKKKAALLGLGAAGIASGAVLLKKRASKNNEEIQQAESQAEVVQIQETVEGENKNVDGNKSKLNKKNAVLLATGVAGVASAALLKKKLNKK